MSPRLPLPLFTSSSDARVASLQGLLIAAIVITALYVGREVLLPLALAILLSFVLTPALLLLRRLKVPRVLGVGIVVTFAFGIIFGLGWMMSQQATELAGELPRYQTVLAGKVAGLRRSAASIPAFQRATDALNALESELANPRPDTSVGSEPSASTQADEQKKPLQVEIHQPRAPLELYQDILSTLLPPLVTAGIVILFVIFILLQREDLRDRLIRLIGASDLQRATSAMNDAAERLSHYFLRQVLINAAYGVFITLGLWLIGVPSPAVWGILAMLMRFVPYVGPFIAAAPPLLLAAVVDPGWSTFLITGALYLVSELVMGQMVEPMVYGHGTGISPIAVVLSTVFWAWLWGPLGLLLAMPLTVCLVVLGRHVEGLSFLELLLGDEPALTPEQSFYQRVLTGDSAEATYQAELCLKEGDPLVDYLDDVALKGLQLAERDAERGALDLAHLDRMKATVEEIMDNLVDFEPRRWFGKVKTEKPEKAPEGHDERQGGLASLSKAEEGEIDALAVLDPSELAPGWNGEEGKEAILCIGARTPLDEAAATMLAGVLTKQGLAARSVDSEAISAGQIVSLEAFAAKLVCLSYLGVGGSPAHVRYLVRRLRRILPQGSTVLVGYWAGNGGGGMVKALEAAAEADGYATSLKDAAAFCLNVARGGAQGSHDLGPARVA